MCDIRFPLTHKFKNLKESALSKFQQHEYQESCQILQEIPLEKMDLSCKILLAKSQKMCHQYKQAKELLSNLMIEHPNNLDVLKESISIYLKTHEYQKALYYFSQLFSIETDHTNDIRHILNVYHKLGLFDRSHELLETLDKNGFPHELFISERIDLAIHTADIMTLSQILTRYRHLLQNIPELLCKVLRNIEVGVSKNFKDEIFLQYGTIHIGSYEDSNTSITLFDSYFFDFDSFYESLLRFTDYVKFHKMKFSYIQAYDQESIVLSKILSVILGLNHCEQDTTYKESTLVVGFDGTDFLREKNAIYFFLQCPNKLVDYPEFVAQIVQSKFQSFLCTINKSVDKTVQEILEKMQNKKHISSLSYAGQEVLFTRFDHFKLDRSHSETRKNVVSIHSSQNQNVFSERSLDSFEASLENDGLLYINSYLHKKDLLNQVSFTKLCQLHKSYLFQKCNIPSVLYDFDANQTLGFYLTEFQTYKNNPNFVDILHQLKHFKTQEFQLKWFSKDSAFHNEFFSNYKYWSELEEHPDFYPLIIQTLESHSPAISNILHNIEKLSNLEKLIPILEKLILSPNIDCEIKHLIFIQLSVFEHLEPTLTRALLQINKPHEKLIDYLANKQVSCPDPWIEWLQQNRSHSLYAYCIVQFTLLDFFQKEWREYWHNQEGSFPFASFHKIEDKSFLQWIDQNVSNKSNIEYQKFLLLNHSFYPHLRDILMDSELKLALSKELIQTYGEWVDNSPVKDLLFLMLSDDESKISLANQYFLRGDIEYYMFLVNRFFTHGHKYGQQIITSLFRFRSDKAIQLLAEGMKQNILSWQDINFLFQWIQNDLNRRDEFLSFLSKNEVIKSDLVLQLKRQMNHCPQLLEHYIQIKSSDNIEDICEELFKLYPNHHGLLKKFAEIDPKQLVIFLKQSKNTTRFAHNFTSI
ncbi:MAG: hypothetical protein KC646_13600 [Candidatus Cloacimonetes bacterium]|nr:hypothetical protein [Candidatus Cloacimonadota bacterium]